MHVFYNDAKNICRLVILADEIGFLDGVLCSHLETVTNTFNSKDWEQHLNGTKNKHAKPVLQRSQLNVQAEKFREQGNALFKAHDFPQAQLLYTRSIAAAIEGPLGSLAYFNRCVCYFSWKL
jgi:hypothetical protein